MNKDINSYQFWSWINSFEKGMARLLPINIPIWRVIPPNTPAYFLYFIGHISKDWINAASKLIFKITCDDTIRQGEQELNQVRENIIIHQRVVIEYFRSQQRNRHYEISPCRKHVNNWVWIKAPSVVADEFANCVTNIVNEEEYQTWPDKL